ncbi:MAG: sugar phosphate nucleotidyltransferase [Candidatus Hodarchaeota archaeon]
MSNEEFSAVILAGGVGFRLRPLTTTRPKPLVPVGNHSMLDYAIDLVRHAGIKKIIVAVKYLGQQIRDHVTRRLEDNCYGDIEIYIPEIDPKDTADAVRRCAHLIDGPFVVSMADVVTNIHLEKFLDYHKRKDSFASITLKGVEQPLQFGVIMLDDNQRINLFLEKPIPQELYLTTLAFSQKQSSSLESNLVNTGMYAFKAELLDLLRSYSDLMDFGKHVFPYLLSEKYSIYGYIQDYYWIDCGTPEKYLWGNWDLLRQWAWPLVPPGKINDAKFTYIQEGITIETGAKIETHVALGTNVRIREGAIIKPLTVIGSSCQIGSKSIIEGSVCWENVTIGSNCKITKAILCDGATIEDNCTLEPGSIIGQNVIVSSGSTLQKGTILHPPEEK